MSEIDDLADGLVARIKTIVGLRADAAMPPQPNPPHAYVLDGGVPNYEVTIGDASALYGFEVWVLVQYQEVARAQVQLREYLSARGAKSIPAAILGDPTLGGVAATTFVRSAQQPGEVEFGASKFWGCPIRVEVMT